MLVLQRLSRGLLKVACLFDVVESWRLFAASICRYIPREQQPTFIWQHDYNFSLYGCLLLFAVKCLRNACAVLLRAAWECAVVAYAQGKGAPGSSTAGGPPVVGPDLSQSSQRQGSGSGTPSQPFSTANTVAFQQRQFREQQQQQRSAGSVYNTGGSFKQTDTTPKLESFGSLSAAQERFRGSEIGQGREIATGSLDSSLPVVGGSARPGGLRARSESFRDDSFGSMTRDATGGR